MLQSKSFVKKTKKGKVVTVGGRWRPGTCAPSAPLERELPDRAAHHASLLSAPPRGRLQVVREHYLRDDIW
jgi:hypothetical protein